MRAMLLWTAAAVAVMGLTWVVYRSAAPGPSPPRQAPTPKSSALVFRLHGPWLEGTGYTPILFSARDQCIFFATRRYQKAWTLRLPWTRPVGKLNACTPGDPPIRRYR